MFNKIATEIALNTQYAQYALHLNKPLKIQKYMKEPPESQKKCTTSPEGSRSVACRDFHQMILDGHNLHSGMVPQPH